MQQVSDVAAGAGEENGFVMSSNFWSTASTQEWVQTLVCVIIGTEITGTQLLLQLDACLGLFPFG